MVEGWRGPGELSGNAAQTHVRCILVAIMGVCQWWRLFVVCKRASRDATDPCQPQQRVAVGRVITAQRDMLFLTTQRKSGHLVDDDVWKLKSCDCLCRRPTHPL